jgi:hypothetical protein
MLRDAVSELIRQRAQVITDASVQVLGADVVRDRRAVVDLLVVGALDDLFVASPASIARLAPLLRAATTATGWLSAASIPVVTTSLRAATASAIS